MKQVYGKQVEWRDIKIGEAFYFTGCEGIAVKVNKEKSSGIFVIDIVGTKDTSTNDEWFHNYYRRIMDAHNRVYPWGILGIWFHKLPRSFAKQLEAL